MRGLAIEVKEPWLDSEDFENEVIGLIVDKEYPQADVIDALRTCPWEDAVWVIRKDDRLALSACTKVGIEPVRFGLNPYYKSDRFDRREMMRECDMMYGCTRILVFHVKSSNVNKHWYSRISARAKIHIVAHGKEKKKRGNTRRGSSSRD